MRPLAEVSAPQARAIRAVFTDVDGTLTDAEGRIPSAVFAAMERCRADGLFVVPVTGRPAGWADLIARTWPVDGVIAENGGVAMRREARDGVDRLDCLWAQDAATRRRNRAWLDALAVEVLAAHPGAALASDQAYRVFDVAVDFCEDVSPLDRAEVDAIEAQLRAAGCTVKVSNIHVNAWLGDFDKASMCRQVAAMWFGWSEAELVASATFFGDSPNDAPLFAAFPLAIGVAGVARMADRIHPLPGFVARGDGWRGFVEGVDLLLRLRRSI